MPSSTNETGNVSKLVRYNHILFAVIGTASIVMVVLAVLIGGVVAAFEMVPARRQGNKPLSNAEVQKWAKDSMRAQIVSLGAPMYIDSAAGAYIIPVSQKRLKGKEKFGAGSAAMDRGGYNSYSRSHRSYGPANNMIHYESVTGLERPIFDTRVSINSWEMMIVDTDVFLFMYCATMDTDKNGVLSGGDLGMLYVYSPKDRKLRALDIDGHTIIDAELERPTNDIILEVGVDRDGNGQYDYSSEPTLLKKCSRELEGLQDLVHPDTLNRLQKLLEGAEAM